MTGAANIRGLRSISCVVLMALVGPIGAQTLPIHEGTRVLRSGDLVVEVGDPDSEDCRWNQGLRFSPVANVLRLQLRGQEFLYSPVGGGSVGWAGGLAMEFDIGQEAFQPDPPGYNEGQNGDPFLKIGVGILQRNSSEYNFSSGYPVIELAQTVTTWEADRAHFVQTLTGTANGYAYRLEEDVIVKNDRLIMRYVLENTGTKEFTTEQYLHNFLTFSGRPVGPDYRIYFPYDFTASPDVEPWSPPASRTMRLAASADVVRLGNIVAYLATISGVPKTWIYKPEDYAGREVFAVEQTGMGQRMIIDTSAPSAYVGIWTTDYQVSPEQFVLITLAPGERATFTRTYVVSAEGALVADNTGDGVVDARDLSTLSSAWLAEPGIDDWEPACDIAVPMDDKVDLDDLAVQAASWRSDAQVPVPVAHWRLDETTGSLASDRAGRAPGVLRGFAEGETSWTAGKVTGGLTFDGIDDRIDVDGWTAPCGKRARTVTTWVKTTERSDAAMTIIAWGGAAPGGSFALGLDASGRLQATCNGGRAVASGVVGDVRWHHVAAVLDPMEAEIPRISDVRLYIDGKRQNLHELTEHEIETGCQANVSIGHAPEGQAPSPLAGTLDEIQIFTIPLTAGNIEAIYEDLEG